MQEKPKKQLLTPERTMEVADSLQKESNSKKSIGNTNKRIAEGFISKGKGESTLLKSQVGGLTANERLELSKKQLKESDVDAKNAAKYKGLALQAMKKKK
jgi:hypothetical protein